MRRPWALVAALALAACATLNEDQCRTVDWQTLGDSDGVAGHRQTRIADHAKACNKHGIAVDQAAYLQGWARGIRAYCVPQRGYAEGRDGRVYRNSCPSDLAGPFEAAYRPAKRAFDAEAEVDRLERSIDRAVTRLAQLAGSDDPKAKDRARGLRNQLDRDRSALRRARREDDRARDTLLRFLRANPSLVP